MEISLQAKEIRNAYQRAWRRNNIIKMRNYHANYWNKKAKIREENNPQPVKYDDKLIPDLVEPLTQNQRCQMNELFQDLKSR